MNSHGSAGYRICQNGTGVAEHFPVMIISCLQVQGFVICVDILRNGLGGAEIHRSSFNIPEFTGGNVLRIIRTEETTGKNQNLLHCNIRLFVAGKIEIAVVCHVKDGIHISCGIINDVQTAFVIQFVCNLNRGVSREPLIAVRTVQFKCDRCGCLLDGFPEPQMKIIRTAVQIVLPVIWGECVMRCIECELCILQPIGIAANCCTQTGAICSSVTVAVIITQYDVSKVIRRIRDKKFYQSSAVIRYAGSDRTVVYGIEGCLLTCGKDSKILFHNKISFG